MGSVTADPFVDQAIFPFRYIAYRRPLIESNGYIFVLIMIEAFAKLCFLHPIFRQDSSALKRGFTNNI